MKTRIGVEDRWRAVDVIKDIPQFLAEIDKIT